MSAVRKADAIRTDIMVPMLSGDYHQRGINKFAWQCLGQTCGLVWPMKHQAEDCESRGHVAHFEQVYVAGPIINGVPRYTTTYPRNAIRKDAI